MGQVGETLRQARKEKGISLKEAEEATKISSRYLKALENEDYQILPGRVYILGFLRIYSAYLGLEVQEIVNQFKTTAPEKEAKVAVGTSRRVSCKVEPRNKQFAFNNKKFYGIGLIVLIVLLLFSGFIYRRMLPEPPDNLLSSGQQQVVTPENSQVPDLPAPPPVTDSQPGVEVVVTVKVEECWLGVTIDGRPIFNGTLAAGETKTFRGRKKVNITFGNAGAVQVTQNGRDVGVIGAKSNVVTRSFVPLL